VFGASGKIAYYNNQKFIPIELADFTLVIINSVSICCVCVKSAREEKSETSLQLDGYKKCPKVRIV